PAHSIRTRPRSASARSFTSWSTVPPRKWSNEATLELFDRANGGRVDAPAHCKIHAHEVAQQDGAHQARERRLPDRARLDGTSDQPADPLERRVDAPRDAWVLT